MESYEVSYRPIGGSNGENEERKTNDWIMAPFSNSRKEKSMSLTNLLPRSPYEIRIRCKNQKGNFGNYSNSDEFSTLKKPKEKPKLLWDAIEHGKGYTIKDGGITLVKTYTSGPSSIISNYVIKSSVWESFTWEFRFLSFSLFFFFSFPTQKNAFFQNV